ncbi:MAG: CHAD domain-containing protein [Desulfobacteraceae bacterium]|nr:MAG: CHAD domain-containing protein [Desulfobacteraceae bacterium]
MCNTIKFSLPGELDTGALISELAAHYSIKKDPVDNRSILIYDTFDWRLFKKSFVLYKSGDKLFLRQLNENEILHRASIKSMPAFIWEFPDGLLKEKLAPILEARILLKLVELEIRSTSYRILNHHEKTVARIAHEEICSSPDNNSPPPSSQLCIYPVRGYLKYSRKIVKLFEERGLQTSKKDDIYFSWLEAAGKKPGSYSTKIDILLTHDMRSDEAAKAVFYFLLRIIRINGENIEKDLDTEFIHDFRVAVRRTCTALGQIKYVFPEEETERFKKDFSSLGKLTGELRDLDIYLLNENIYKEKLSPALRKNINPLFILLKKKRSDALHKVIQGLKSKKYETMLGDWKTFLNKSRNESPEPPNAGCPAIMMARTRIYKKYRGVIKAGYLALGDANDKKLHELRIHCKKLRYLMEFFSSLFPPDKINVLIDQLKKLQDNLGGYNDLCVQEEYLLTITNELSGTGLHLKRTLIAIGSLVETLGRARQSLKDDFTEIFTGFASPENKKIFRELFYNDQQRTVNENTGGLQ